MKHNYKLKFLLFSALISFAALKGQTTYSFTPAGATGSLGPTQASVNTAYASTNLNGSVTIGTQGIQQFTVPINGIYRIEARGAQGYGNGFGGRGAIMTGDFNFTAGQVLKIAVGQQGVLPAGATYSNQFGGGGGSFVTDMSNTPYIVAGGGGGSWATAFTTLSDGTITTSGSPGVGGVGFGLGGTNGSGGAGINNADGGGGLTGDGTGGGGGKAFINGANGGVLGLNGIGGFGGGGGTSSQNNRRGGGGGGYSGGGGGYHNAETGSNPEGGGGGSYNNGLNQVNTSGVNLGQGMVIITALCNVTVTPSSTLICAGATVTLSSTPATSYTWSSSGSTASSITVAPLTTTSYTAYGAGTIPSGCIATTVITIVVNNTPTVSIAASSPTACLGGAVTLTASGANTYNWTGGSTNIITSFTPAATTNYTVTGTNACGTATAGITITLSALPVTASASSTLVCAGTAATLTPTGATTYTWYPGPTVITNNIVLPNALTVYTVLGSTGVCQGLATITISTKPNPTITIASSTGSAICEGASATFTASGGLSYTWSPGTGLFGPNITVNPATSTLYQVTGINNVNCTSSTTQLLLVNAAPVLNVSASDDLVCVGGASTLTASGANTYAWSSSGSSFTTVVNPGVTTTYTVTGTSTANCSSSTVITVAVFDPTLSVSSSTAICKGFNTNLTASGMDGFVWSNNSLTFPIITVTPAVTTIYTVTGTSTSGTVSCSNSGTVAVTVHPNPTITAMATPPNICKNESAVLTASGAVTYTWVAVTTTVAPSVTVSPAATQNYTVTGTDANGCMGANKTTISLPVSECIGLSDNTAQAPGFVIYPNPNNGEFTIRADEAIDLQIVNELGQQVKTLSLGQVNGNEVKITGLANGIYFITGQNQNGTVKQKIVITK